MKKKIASPPLPGDFRVTAFYGPAGTGKSMRAQMIARKKKIDILIDDGLVICKGRIIAGKSAKTEPNMVRAIRRAMFQFEDHREEARKALTGYKSARVMVLSTSRGMSDDICTALGLPLPLEYIRIEDVADDDEIARALYERKHNKRHVIPVAQAQIQKNYTGRLVGRLKNLFSGRDEAEKTIVRPPFSYYGTLKIEPEAVEQITAHVVKSLPQVTEAKDIKVKDDRGKLAISAQIAAKAGELNFRQLIKSLSVRIRIAVEQLTGMEISRIDITITEVAFND